MALQQVQPAQDRERQQQHNQPHPSGAGARRTQPFGAYSAVKAMPATGVGSANGRSIIASTSLRPGKRVRTSTQAISSPAGTLNAAAPSATPKLRRRAASTRGLLIEATKPAIPNSHGRSVSAGSGSTTSSPTPARGTPISRPNPPSVHNPFL